MSPRNARVSPLGLACAAAGASLWGLSFVAPLFAPGVSAWDVSLGRYLVFGVVGWLLVLRSRAAGVRLPSGGWGAALLFGLTGYYGCYTAMVAAIDLAGPAPVTLVMGLTPVSVALAATLRTRRTSWTRLAGPLALIGCGLALANLFRHADAAPGRELAAGLLLAFAALGLLTFYLVANMSFLKRHPEVSPLAWANVQGAALLVFSLAALAFRAAFSQELPWSGGRASPMAYLGVSLILGLGVSWLGGALWNKANALLPPTLAGQCIVFWPVSGILYACLLAGRPPSAPETLGMVMVFAGVAWGVRSSGPDGAGA